MAVFTNDADQTGLASGTTLTVGNSGGGTNTALTGVTGAITVDNGDSDFGALSYLHAAVTGTASYYSRSVTAVSSMTVKNYFKFSGYPSTTIVILEPGSTGTNWVGLTSTGRLTVSSAGGVLLASSAAVLTPNTRYRVEMALTIAASGATVIVEYYLGESSTPIQTLVNTTTANTGTTNVAFVRSGKVTAGGNLAAFRTDGLAWAPGQTTLIGPNASAPDYPGSLALTSVGASSFTATPATAGVLALTSIGTLGVKDASQMRVALIGDSTLINITEAAMRAALVAKGYLNANIWFYAVVNKTIATADSNGYTTLQNMAQARAALGAEPDVWLFNLGSNGHTSSDATNTGWIQSVMNDTLPTSRVLWNGISQVNGYSDPPFSEATRWHWNALAKPVVLSYPNGEFEDWDAYFNANGTEDMWDSSGVHMNLAGYTLKKNFNANNIGTPTAGARVGMTGALALTSTGTLGVTGTPTAAGTLALSSVGGSSFAGAPVVVGALTLVSAGSSTFAGSAQQPGAGTGALALTSTGTSTTTATAPTLAGSLALTGTSLLSFAARAATTGALALTSTGTVTFTGTPGAPAPSTRDVRVIPGATLARTRPTPTVQERTT